MFGKVHYAKVDPLERATIKASVGGAITKVDLSAEGRIAGEGVVIQIDDAMDRVSLASSKASQMLFQETLKINNEILTGLEETYRLKKGYFDRVNALSTSTQTQKDNAYSTYISAKTQYLSTREKIVSLQKQIIDMKYRITQLEDTIKKKSIVLFNRYLYKLMVRTGDYVNPGTPLAAVYDISKAKLVLFLEPEELNKVKEKRVYIDGKKTEYRVNKVWNVADEKFISSYRAEIYLPAPKEKFSQLLKVELK